MQTVAVGRLQTEKIPRLGVWLKVGRVFAVSAQSSGFNPQPCVKTFIWEGREKVIAVI